MYIIFKKCFPPSLLLIFISLLSGVCKIDGQKISTFTGQNFDKRLPPDCFMTLLQDCTCDKKFMVLIKYESNNANNILLKLTIAGR